ncbi:hypothetical protein QYE76_050600 [Lolium multiflorum]|uniref:Uncharacterized protein n=1 Tax=Lolium multiflorum TaxID=4521 RepID=A0AAD8WHZ1_LOLMU|nr:hypothetical protein QYE76_050600 [Lolium multiflorum]
MHEVMTCCVIMYNMIVENERPDGRNEHHWDFQDVAATASAAASFSIMAS